MHGDTSQHFDATGGGRLRVHGAFAGGCIAEGAIWISLLVYAYGRGGVAETSAVAVLLLAPMVLLAPAWAALAGRFGHSRSLGTAFALQAVLACGVGLCMWRGPSALWVYLGAGLLCSSMSATRPIVNSMLPAFSDAPPSAASNRWVVAFDGLGGLAGPVLAGAILGLFGTAAVLLAAALLLGAAALCIAVSHDLPRGTSRPRGRSGAAFLRRHPEALTLVGGLAVPTLLFGSVEILAPAIGDDLVGASGGAAGFLVGVLGLGSVVGAVTAMALEDRGRLLARHTQATLAAALCFVGLAFCSSLAGTLTLLFLCGVANGRAWVFGISLVQRIAPERRRILLFGLLEGGEAAALMFATGCIALGSWSLGLRGAVLVVGVVALSVVFLSHPRMRRLETARSLALWAHT